MLSSHARNQYLPQPSEHPGVAAFLLCLRRRLSRVPAARPRANPGGDPVRATNWGAGL